MDEDHSPLDFFGLREQPFAPTADPAYFYAAADHKECLFRLWQNLDQREGAAVVLGSHGVGKTMLLRKLVSDMSAEGDRYRTAVIGSPLPAWNGLALLDAITAQFGLPPAGQNYVEQLESLNQFLLANRDGLCTLIVDDAQNLNKRGQMELLRLLQNLETQQHKLLNMVFFAHSDWADVLRAAPGFSQRVNLTYTLGPLDFEEVRHFIEFRLFQAGAVPDRAPVFDEAALRAIHAAAEGNPRLITSICRHALLAAAQLRTRRIGHEIIVHTIDKTMLPGLEMRARVAAAVLQAAPAFPPRAAQEETREVPPLARLIASTRTGTTEATPGVSSAPLTHDLPAGDSAFRDRRAAELLLRALRGNAAGQS